MVDLVYFTLGHLRKPGAALTVPKGTSDMRSKEVRRAGTAIVVYCFPFTATLPSFETGG